MLAYKSRVQRMIEVQFINLPPSIPSIMTQNAIKKSELPLKNLVILGVLAGAFIALGAMGSSAAAHALEGAGVQKLVQAFIFPAGLIMVMLCGAELFTGDCLAAVACYQKKMRWAAFARVLVTVWLANMLGAVLVAVMVFLTPQWQQNGHLLGAYTLSIAANKTSIAFVPAFFSGILCNVMVCLAIWTATASVSAAGKVVCCLFPMLVFILGGFEHCVANMYYIPAGLLAKTNPNYVSVATAQLGVLPSKIEALNASNFFLANLLPVTLGNIIGGAVFVGGAYTLAYLK